MVILTPYYIIGTMLAVGRRVAVLAGGIRK